MVSLWLSVCLSICPSVFSFLDDNLSKYKWIFTKLGVCIDIEKIWFGIANGQILSIFMPPTSKKLEEHIASGSCVRALRFLMHSITSEPCMLGF